jgi:hypothetical protein
LFVNRWSNIIQIISPFQAFKIQETAATSFFESEVPSRFEIKFEIPQSATNEVLSIIILLTDSLSQFDLGSSNCVILVALSFGR